MSFYAHQPVTYFMGGIQRMRKSLIVNGFAELNAELLVNKRESTLKLLNESLFLIVWLHPFLHTSYKGIFPLCDMCDETIDCKVIRLDLWLDQKWSQDEDSGNKIKIKFPFTDLFLSDIDLL